jgi:hypothetical protein
MGVPKVAVSIIAVYWLYNCTEMKGNAGHDLSYLIFSHTRINHNCSELQASKECYFRHFPFPEMFFDISDGLETGLLPLKGTFYIAKPILPSPIERNKL